MVPQYQQLPRRLITGFLLLGIRELFRFVLKLPFSFFQYLLIMKKTESFRKLYRSCATKSVLILGNGPSVNNLSPEQLKKFQQNGGDIFVMNDFALSKLAKSFEPNFYFVCDPYYWNLEDPLARFKTLRIQKYMNEQKDMRVIQSAFLPKFYQGFKENLQTGTIPFHGFFNFSNPCGFWSHAPSTTLVAIATAARWGYENIYFAGLDSDTYLNYSLNSLNEIMLTGKQYFFYGENTDAELASRLQKEVFYVGADYRDYADILFANALFRRSAKRLLQGKGINVGGDLTNDSAWRASLIK